MITVIEKYYDDGKVTIQIDYTKGSQNFKSTNSYDEYNVCISEKRLKKYLEDFGEPYKMLPNIK